MDDIRKATHDAFATELGTLILKHGPRDPFSSGWDGIIDALAAATGVYARSRGQGSGAARLDEILKIVRKEAES